MGKKSFSFYLNKINKQMNKNGGTIIGILVILGAFFWILYKVQQAKQRVCYIITYIVYTYIQT